ncbi:maleylpyruvate isomerase family mycothiol-dependent enzyme [Kocuria sp. M1R5S2]|uniref:maleylpyruvate isomerase family mycothiol-dependent enzyme n=1 Tax=Kocuria rhizosphaerae TaxID=3376285 RepID=UPI00378ABEF3
MNTTTTTGTRETPRRSALDRAVAMRLAIEEYRRVADAVESLQAPDWDRPTDCPDWTVRELVAHVAGMMAMAASPIETLRQTRKATREASASGIQHIDALTALQVAERADAGPEQLRREIRHQGPRAARGRRMTPALVRSRRMNPAQHVGGREEWWTIGYLLDTVLTRDPWMHRIDLQRATGRGVPMTAEHDGAIVADVVEEWAVRHGRPFRLVLTGPAGGTWTRTGAAPAPELELSAVEFCRTVSGRRAGEGLLATEVPF